jgi:recombination protein RecT
MADGDIIVAKQGELILPAPRNDGAALARNRLDAILAQLPAGVERGPWAAAAIAEANAVEATPASIAGAIFNASFLGLTFGKALGHAHIVPFKGQAQLVIGYRGWIHLAYSTGFLSRVYADVVCQGEGFEYWVDEMGPRMRHTPALERDPNRGDIVAAYCIYHTKDGGTGLKVVPRKQIDKSDKGRDVWQSNYPAMAMKTAILRSAKLWNNTARTSKAIEIEEQAERDELQTVEGFEPEPVQKPRGVTLPKDED